MSEQVAQKITDLGAFVTKHYGRRVEVTCKEGTIFTAEVNWYVEFDEEETGELFGIMFDDVIKTGGETISGIALPLSYIDSFIPLEGENSAADIKRLWGK